MKSINLEVIINVGRYSDYYIGVASVWLIA